MIGALGRHGDEGIMDEDLPEHNSAQFVKFYQSGRGREMVEVNPGG
jgi:hypothetical protein